MTLLIFLKEDIMEIGIGDMVTLIVLLIVCIVMITIIGRIYY